MEKKVKRPAVFLDRDGTILKPVPYLRDPAQTELIEGARDSILKLNEASVLAVVISNQSGIGRGFFSFKELFQVSEKMEKLLLPAKLDGIYYDPSSPDHGSGFRKPERGMIDSACSMFGIDTSLSWIIGDDYSDLMLSIKTGIKFILVLTGYGKNVLSQSHDSRKNFTIAKDIGEAVQIVLNA